MTHPTIRGRGAAHNPANRFDRIQVEREDWVEAEDPAPETQFFRDATRSIIARNDSPDVGFDASINPYRGCDRSCVYCLWGGTPILMADGTTKPLADLKRADEIYGAVRRDGKLRYRKTEVLYRWETTKPAYRITLEDGTEIVASGDHRFRTWRGWKFVTGTEHGRLRRPHLTTNDRLLGVGAFQVQYPTSPDYMVGYLCGMIRGDAHLACHGYLRSSGKTGRVNQFRLALVEVEALGRTEHYLSRFGVDTIPFLFTEGSDARQEMFGIRTARRRNVLRIQQLIGWPSKPTFDRTRGFLAGIFDAEGSYSQGALRISNSDPIIIEETVRGMRRLGFDCVVECGSEVRERPVKMVRLRGGLRAHLRFFQTARPAISRKRNFEGQALKASVSLRVVSIDPLGPATLYDIMTGTGNFISDGILSHNCYARPGHEYFGLSAGLDFETKIFVKEDAPELLRKELSSPRWKPQVLVMSGVTDPYQSIEKRMRITRRCLEVLNDFRNPVAIITKSHLVTRDADILGEMASYRAAAANLSITTLRNELQRVMEPRAATPARRLDAIRKLTAAGIPCGVMVAPVIPGLTDHEMPEILERAAEAGATRAGYIMLRLPYAVKELFEDWLGRHFPDRKRKVLNRLRDLRRGALYDSRWNVRMTGEGPFADQVKQVFEVACRRHGLNRDRFTLSTDAFRRPHDPTAPGPQLSLL
ncbi:MAG: PA0069 family radical SAM protein [Gemmatimonadota bacterium]